MKTEEYKPKPADLDLVQVACSCGNTFDLPFDCCFGMDRAICGQCHKKGQFEVVADPSPNAQKEPEA